MRAPAKPKPRAADEVARVVLIVEMLDEELRSVASPIGIIVTKDTEFTGPHWDLLDIAERIAARTEG